MDIDATVFALEELETSAILMATVLFHRAVNRTVSVTQVILVPIAQSNAQEVQAMYVQVTEFALVMVPVFVSLDGRESSAHSDVLEPCHLHALIWEFA